MATFSALSNFTSSITAVRLGGNCISSSTFYFLSPMNGTLVVINLSNNMLEGHRFQLDGLLLKSICKIYNLKVIDFSSNNFTGNLEELLSGLFPYLQLIDSSKRISTNSSKLSEYWFKTVTEKSIILLCFNVTLTRKDF